jgi:hypothetical protein
MYHVASGTITTDRERMDIKYRSLEILFGGRRYIHLVEDSKLYVDVGLIIGAPMNATLTVDDFDRVIGEPSVIALTDTGLSPEFGIGYEYMGRFFGEIRVQGKRGSRGPDYAAVMKYQSTCLNIGYRFF